MWMSLLCLCPSEDIGRLHFELMSDAAVSIGVRGPFEKPHSVCSRVFPEVELWARVVIVVLGF